MPKGSSSSFKSPPPSSCIGIVPWRCGGKLYRSSSSDGGSSSGAFVVSCRYEQFDSGQSAYCLVGTSTSLEAVFIVPIPKGSSSSPEFSQPSCRCDDIAGRCCVGKL